MNADFSACLQSVSPRSVCDERLPAAYRVQPVPQMRLRYVLKLCYLRSKSVCSYFGLTLIDMYGGVLYLFYYSLHVACTVCNVL